MSIENEAYKAAQTENDLPDIEEIEEAAGSIGADQQPGISFDFGFLRAKTGPGSIDEYIDHPLNFKASKGMAQMIRGFTGIAGELDLAIVDITLGAFNYIKEEKDNVRKPATVNPGWE